MILFTLTTLFTIIIFCCLTCDFCGSFIVQHPCCSSTVHINSRRSSIALSTSNSSLSKTKSRKKKVSVDGQRNTGNKNKKNKKKYSSGSSRSSSSSPQPRPILTQYEKERNNEINRYRLSSQNNINCEHFESCPGCIVQTNIGQIDIIQSAQKFFSSTAIRKNRLDVELSGEDWVVEEENDGFYKVVVPSDTIKWRTQAKLMVAPKSSSWAKDGCIFGLYQRGSHDVLNIPNCQVHHPSINRAVHALEKASERVGTPAFNVESRDANGLRYVQLQVERTTGKICLTLVWGTNDIKSTQPSLSRLTKELTKLEPDLWHSIWCHTNDSPGNNIFSRNTKNWHRMSGNEFVREPLPVGEYGWLYFSPLAFRQGNMDGFDIIANDVARAVPSGSKVCELYAGVGLLGLTSLVYHHDLGSARQLSGNDNKPLVWVRCSDENPANTRCFSRSLQSLPREITEHPRNHGQSSTMTMGEMIKRIEAGEMSQNESGKRIGPKATYAVANAGTALKSGQALGANVLIVDPPRRGLEEDVLDELCKPFNPKQPNVESSTMLTIDDELVNWVNDVQTLIYVSCGFDALARDCDKLLSSPGGWKLQSATGYVLFPGSNHVETLCIFQRK